MKSYTLLNENLITPLCIIIKVDNGHTKRLSCLPHCSYLCPLLSLMIIFQDIISHFNTCWRSIFLTPTLIERCYCSHVKDIYMTIQLIYLPNSSNLLLKVTALIRANLTGSLPAIVLQTLSLKISVLSKNPNLFLSIPPVTIRS